MGPPWSARQLGLVMREEVPPGERPASLYFESHCDFDAGSVEAGLRSAGLAAGEGVDVCVSPVVTTLLGMPGVAPASYALVQVGGGGGLGRGAWRRGRGGDGGDGDGDGTQRGRWVGESGAGGRGASCGWGVTGWVSARQACGSSARISSRARVLLRRVTRTWRRCCECSSPRCYCRC